MKQLIIALMAGFFTMACGSDDCDEASDKLADCGITNFEIDFDNESCDGRVECVADCLDDASCAEIAESDPTVDSALNRCIAGC